MDFFQKIADGILDVLFPPEPYCTVCAKKLETGERYICSACEKRLAPILPPVCKKCGRPLDTDSLCRDCRTNERTFVQARSFGHYDGVLKELIHLFKYGGRRELARLLGGRMVGTLAVLSWPDFDYIVPVPLHAGRERERGFNQAYLLASVVSRSSGVPIYRGLIRVKPTEHQTFLDKTLRKKNLEGAFKVENKSRIEGKTLLLIDDVYTTGSTVDECARTIKNAGADSVFVLTCARG
ncbi:MAG: ComF family protein [Tepidanaerobacteraceae bacterium]|nr:ComF family protein [Tepidanaerobacteraceae bacterium]